MNETLQLQLNQLQLPKEAINWLLSLYDIIQGFDDVMDKAELETDAVYNLVFSSIVAMPTNPFYLQNIASLATLVNLNLLKWIASNKVEKEGNADAKSYNWRAGYYDIVLNVVFICHGFATASKNADKILSLYGEKLEDYLKEFGQCQIQ